MWYLLSLLSVAICAAQTTDGGRGELPGMRKDIFDQMKDAKNKGPTGQTAKRPECPKSDKLSPFRAFCIVQGQIYVKIDDSEEKCRRVVSIGGANASALFDASRTCGAVGEWKRRVAEEFSAVYFVGGWEEWPKSEGEPVEIEFEDGNVSVPITPENYEVIKECWARGCSCEQAANPKMKAILLSLLAICVFGIGNDGVKLIWEKIFGTKKDKEKKDKKDKKEKKEKKEKKSKKTDDEVTGDESTETKSEKDDKDDGDDGKSSKETDGDGKDEKEETKEAKSDKDDASDR